MELIIEWSDFFPQVLCYNLVFLDQSLYFYFELFGVSISS